jgi:hypothetical protein
MFDSLPSFSVRYVFFQKGYLCNVNRIWPECKNGKKNIYIAVSLKWNENNCQLIAELVGISLDCRMLLKCWLWFLVIFFLLCYYKVFTVNVYRMKKILNRNTGIAIHIVSALLPISLILTADNLALWATCCLICFIPIIKPFLTHWSWLRVVPSIERGNRAHGGCDRSTGDAQSSMAPDPTSGVSRGPCKPDFYCGLFHCLNWTLILTADFYVNLTRHTDFDNGMFRLPNLDTLILTTDFYVWYWTYGGCDRSAGDAYSSMAPDDYLRFYVPLKNFSLIWRRHHCRWRAAKCRPMLSAQGLWAGRDLYRATPTVTRGLGFSGLIWRTAPISRLLRQIWGCGGSIPTRILTGESHSKDALEILMPKCWHLFEGHITYLC